MPRMRAASGLLALCVLLGLSRAADSPAPFDSAMRRLMEPAGFRSDDFNLLINYRAEIPRTLPAVETLLRRPQTVDSLVPALRGEIRYAATGTFSRSDDLYSAKKADSVSALWRWIGVDSIARIGALHGSIEANLKEYLAPLNPGEREFLLREAPALFRAREDDTLLNPWESEAERLRGEAILDSVMRLAARLPSEDLARAALELEKEADKLRYMASHLSRRKMASTLRAGSHYGWGSVTIGTSGNDVHRVDQGIVFDPGGNDRYVFPDAVRPGTFLLILDVSGNDTYVANDTVGAAAGFLSAQIIADLTGNDRYEAFGSAVMGYSRLLDLEGDDIYTARCASLGFAFHGIGILEDRSGNDRYSTAYFSQGAASTNGMGILLDDAGDDRYISRPVYPDDLRYRDHFLSLSQGFSSGFAPRYAGGIGVLWDRAGEDVYTADIFAQGTGYWFGWGLLMDDAGNDTLRAYQYAQGAGVHFAAGTLRDAEGNDVRVSKGVSQGCGHDGGFGLLADFLGSDSTAAVDMSAGAGSANGLGVFLDVSGTDIYSMANRRMTLGHGDMRRDRGSFGFFLDLGGPDAYPAGSGEGPREGAAWRVYDGKLKGYGHGLDSD
jgi:hypothetical protein